MKKTTRLISKTKDFQRIVLPVDGSDDSARAVKKALSLARETGVDVTALHVMDVPYLASTDLNYTNPDLLEIIKKRGDEVLDEVKKQG